MTLQYESNSYRPPSRTGLLVCGILMLVGAVGSLLSVGFVIIATRMGGAGVSQSTPSLLLVSALPMLASAVFMAWLGIDMIRGRRWVRPFTLAMAGWSVITSASGLLGIFVNAFTVQQNAALPLWATLIPAFSLATFGLGLPIAYFLFFRTDAVVETLRYMQPTPAWTDRYTTVALVLAIVAALSALFQFPAVVGYVWLGVKLHSPGAFVLALVAIALSVWLAATAVMFLRRPRTGWRMFLIYTGLILLVALTTGLLFPGLNEQLATGLIDAKNVPKVSAARMMIQQTTFAFAYALTLLLLRKDLR